MPSSRYTENVQEAWNWLYLALRNEFPLSKNKEQHYILTTEYRWDYLDHSSEEYLLDDIAFALVDECLPSISLSLRGREDCSGISNFYRFTFTKAGLVKAFCHYNDD